MSKRKKEQSSCLRGRLVTRERKLKNGQRLSELVRYKTNEEPTKCWSCKQADASGDCPWANNLIPRNDWKAEESTINLTRTVYRRGAKIKTYVKESKSFRVIDCPGYTSDKNN